MRERAGRLSAHKSDINRSILMCANSFAAFYYVCFALSLPLSPDFARCSAGAIRVIEFAMLSAYRAWQHATCSRRQQKIDEICTAKLIN